MANVIDRGSLKSSTGGQSVQSGSRGGMMGSTGGDSGVQTSRSSKPRRTSSPSPSSPLPGRRP